METEFFVSHRDWAWVNEGNRRAGSRSQQAVVFDVKKAELMMLRALLRLAWFWSFPWLTGVALLAAAETGASRLIGDNGSSVAALDTSADGSVLAMYHFDSSFTLWELSTGKALARFAAQPVGARMLSRDGKRLAYSAGTAVHVIDTATGGELATIGGSAPVTGLRFCPDGKRLALMRPNSVELWELEALKQAPIVLMDGQPCLAVDFSFDGALLAVLGREAVEIWDVKAKQQQARWKSPSEGLAGFAFVPNDIVVVADVWARSTDAFDRFLVIWNISRRVRRRTRFEHIALPLPRPQFETRLPSDFDGGVEPKPPLSFSPAGRRLLTAGERVVIWDALTGEHLRTIPEPTRSLSAMAFRSEQEIITATMEELAPQPPTEVANKPDAETALLVKRRFGLTRWDAESGALRKTQIIFEDETNDLFVRMLRPLLTGNAKYLVVPVSQGVRVWNAEEVLPATLLP